MSTNNAELREKIEAIQFKYGYGDIGYNKIIELIDQEKTAAVTEKLEKLKSDMTMHTVPEGKHLITRSYLNNAIDFELSQLKQEETK